MSDATPSRRQRIIESIIGRLEAINGEGNFQTNAGVAAFFKGYRPTLGDADPDFAIALTIGTDRLQWQGNKMLIDLPIEISALAKVDKEDAFASIEALIADIKRAMELDDTTLDGLLRDDLEREPTTTFDRRGGAPDEGAVLVYVAPYAEAWGAP